MLRTQAEKIINTKLVSSLDVEKLVSVAVCDAGNGCEEQQFGDKGNNTKSECWRVRS